MKIRLLKPWGEHKAGTILEPADFRLAMRLIAAKIAMAAVGPKLARQIETAEAPQAEEAAVDVPEKRRRGRPRKYPAPEAQETGVDNA